MAKRKSKSAPAAASHAFPTVPAVLVGASVVAAGVMTYLYFREGYTPLLPSFQSTDEVRRFPDSVSDIERRHVIETMQRQLVSLGYATPVDGVEGAATHLAENQFFARNPIPSAGSNVLNTRNLIMAIDNAYGAQRNVPARTLQST